MYIYKKIYSIIMCTKAVFRIQNLKFNPRILIVYFRTTTNNISKMILICCFNLNFSKNILFDNIFYNK